ncbi:calcium binding EGF domain protein [Cooperia oncophora]
MEWMLLHDIVVLGYDEKGNTKGDPAVHLKPERLKWDIPEPALAAIDVSMKVAQALIDDVEMALLVFTDYGKGFIKKLGVSPDAYLQMVLQYTYYKNQQKFCLTYEASMTRLYREGRTETVRSCTTRSKAFVLSMVDPSKTRDERLALLRKACDYHQDLYRDAMCGKGVDRHLFALYVIKRYLEEESPFFDRVFPPTYLLSTSQTPLNQVQIDIAKYGMEPERRSKLVTAGECFEACSGGCTGPGPKDCVRCKGGWFNSPEEGCVDINECETENRCPKPHEECINTPGAYKCSCVHGYKREGGKCVVDVEAKPHRSLIPPDTLLKAISMTSLAIIIGFVIWRRSVPLLVLSGIAVALIIFIDMNVNPETIPDDAKKYLGL